MEQDSIKPTEPAAAPPAVPPIRGGELSMPVRKRVWPTVIGVIAIVVGSGGILHGASMLLMPFWQDMMGATMPGDSAQAFDIFAELSVLLAVLLSGIAALLLAGGIGLVQRRRWVVPIIVLWAVLKMAMTIFSAVLTYDAQKIQFGAMTSQQGTPLPGGIGDAVAIFTFVFSILWGWALPVFMLVWFRLRPVRAEVRDWARPRGSETTPPAAH